MSQQIFSDFTVKDHQGQAVSLKSYEGCVVLAVNTASACGFTPQYAELQALHERYHARGLRVIAFPCNQFLKQESGSNEEIQTFCERFSVTFPVMDKIEVNGAQADSLWQWMKARAPGILGSTAIKWNFTKFLIACDGKSVERFAPKTPPLQLSDRIEALLAQSPDLSN